MKKGFKHTQETRDKISASHKKNHKMWREYRAALLRECARESFVETQAQEMAARRGLCLADARSLVTASIEAMAAAAEGAGHTAYGGANGDGQ